MKIRTQRARQRSTKRQSVTEAVQGTVLNKPAYGHCRCLLWILCVSLFAPGAVLSDEPAGELVLEPGETLPPYVQLKPDEPPVPWAVDRVDEFELLDQTGERVTRESLLGKPWVVNFIFARCTYQCPMTSRKIMELNQELAKVDLRFVTITVDPENDDVATMREFAGIWQAKPDRWIFATGKPDEVWKLIREGFKVSAWENVGTERVPGMEFAHDNNLIHIDEQGRILGRYNGMIDAELVTLRRVLKGEIETPLKHRPAVLDALSAAPPALGSGPEDPLELLPRWAQRLPATNAMLNALATILLLTGFMAIKARRIRLHKLLMLYAFGVSVVFLGTYLAYHSALHVYAGIRGKPFTGTGLIRPIYFSILISHIVLAAAVPVLAVVTIVKGLRGRIESHRRWARVTFPIWLYVSVTGVIIYWMLYHM